MAWCSTWWNEVGGLAGLHTSMLLLFSEGGCYVLCYVSVASEPVRFKMKP
jgi:hypothetical protein